MTKQKYKIIETPSQNECGFCWWVPEDVIKVIEYIEDINPDYNFIQFITSPGHGGYPDCIILKRK